MIGKTLNHYEVIESLGAGGMGEVYRATDTKLNRDVAIKVLPAHLADDAERLARMQREAQLLAALNHPNIAAIYGLEETDQIHFLAMELAEGRTLAQKLSDGALSVDESLKIALQIAEALEAAHEAGIVHRDLKPANVQVATEGVAQGQVKVLDFGLAKAYEPDGSTSEMSPDLSASPTMAAAATATGMIMGTAAYMSPEQARGKPLDKRTDIWAFGCVLFETLTGKRAFQGETVTDILAAIVHQEPQWEALPPDTPLRVRDLLTRCLKKQPEERLRDVGECRIAVKEYLADPEGEKQRALAGAEAATATGAGAGASWAAAAAIGAAALAIGAFGGWWANRPAPTTDPLKAFSIPLPEDADWANHPIAISHDGEMVVIALRGADEGLYLRRLGQMELTRIPGTEGAISAFFSPDGDWIGYYNRGAGELMKVSLEGGDPFRLANVGSFRTGMAYWGDDDTILFTTTDGPVWSVSGDGGDPVIVAEPPEGEYHNPQPLPGGGILVEVNSGERSSIGVILPDDGELRTILEEGVDPRYTTSGHVVYGRGDTVWAVPFDVDTLQATGDPRPIHPGVIGPNGRESYFDVARDGTLAYLPGGSTISGGGTPAQMVWIDREGNAESLPIAPAPTNDGRVSPDGSRVAVALTGQEGNDVFVYEVDGGGGLRLTTSGARDPVWSPDGEWVYFNPSGRSSEALYRVRTDGTSATEEEVFQQEGRLLIRAVSPDGSKLLYTRVRENGDLYWYDLENGGEPEPLVESEFNEQGGVFSPDGRFVAYDSDVAGDRQVFVLDLETRRPHRVSRLNGWAPVWSRDGTEIFFRDFLGNLMVAEVVATEPEFETGAPEELFALPPQVRSIEDVAPDGRFFANRQQPDGDPETTDSLGPQINVVLNWFEELRERADGGR